MTTLSNILNSKYPSTTSFIAALAGSGSGSYTAQGPTQITAAISSGGGGLILNGVGFSSASGSTTVNLFLASGQTLTYSSNSGGQGVISAKRSD